MAADVSSLIGVMNRYKDDRTAVNESNSSLITRDLLGGSEAAVKNDHCRELDLDIQVPSGWEKRLDLKSGTVYLRRCNTPNSPSSLDLKHHQTNQTVPKLQDLNFPPWPSSKPLLNLFDETNLDLKLLSSPSPLSSNFQSVCTLDKVKSALERARREPNKKRFSMSMCNTNSPLSRSYSSSSSSIKDTREDQEVEESLVSSPLQSGAPDACAMC